MLSNILLMSILLADVSSDPFSTYDIPPQIETTESKYKIEKKIRGILLISDVNEIGQFDLDTFSGVIASNKVNLPGSISNLNKKLLPQYKDKPIEPKTLLSIKQEIVRYFNEHDQYVVALEIPEQDVTSGVIAFQVIQPHVGNICYRGNKWFSEGKIAKIVKECPGDLLCEDRLLNNIAWANQNPFHRSEVILSPGEKKGFTDLEVVTKDRFPLRFYTGGDNTGTDSLGTSRYFAGFQWGNAFWHNDLLSYQFMSNQRYNKYHSHSANYTTYLPWQHSLMIYGGYARIHPKITDFKSVGKEAQASFRYKMPFKPLYTHFQQEFFFGFDYKYVTSNLFFIGEVDQTVPEKVSIANVTQAVLGYMLEDSTCNNEYTFKIEAFGSPAKWLPHQTNHSYTDLRSHAKVRYLYGRVSLGDIYTFDSKEAVAFLLRGQGSFNTLLPSEQFVLGGYNTVRGYDENVFVADDAILANFELRTRPFCIFRKAKDALTLLAFMDYGWGYNYSQFDGIKKSATLWSTGAGFRYNITHYVNVRFDYGFKLHSVHFDDNHLGKWHFSAIVSY